MIFVTVGTTEFDDLVRKIDEIAPKISNKITIQIGDGNYVPKNCEYFTFKSPLTDCFKKADIVITHGGAGTLFECLGLGCRIIAVPNPNTKGQHQLDILEELARRGHVILCKDLNALEACIRSKQALKKYVNPKCEIGDVIIKFLEGGSK